MNTDDKRFLNARNAVISAHERFNIGTYNERSQHLFYKLYYEPDTSYHEISVSGYIADIKNNDLITEIQTSSFGRLKDKLAAFLPEYKVKIVYPCSSIKRICWVDTETGDITNGFYRKYSKQIYSLLPELLHICKYINNPNLSIDIAEAEVSELRLLDGYGPDKKKRATKSDIIPDSIIEIKTLNNSYDISDMLPFEDGQLITNAQLSKIFGYRGRKLWMAVQLLLSLNIISLDSKDKNKHIYKFNRAGGHNEESID